MAKKLSLDVEFSGSIPEMIHTDPTRLRQILLNILGNAIKFTDQGSVKLMVKMASPPDAPKPRIRFEVRDTGVGMTPEQMAAIFRPFSQADNSTTRRFGGTGLGLSISKRLAVMLGGEIVAKSLPGQGSSFQITVETGSLQGVRLLDKVNEVMRTAAEEPSDVKTNPETPLSGRVLVAEDGPDNQRLVAFLLRRHGAVVEVAENGQVAIDMVRQAAEAGEPFDCILMDMQMPVLDGYGATRNCACPVAASRSSR